MANDMLKRIDSQIAFHEEELRKLRSAREVIVGLNADDGGDGEAEGPTRLTDSIEQILLDRGPMEASAIHEEAMGLGYESTRNTVNTTLSRLKTKDRVESDGGLWNLTARRRRQLSK